MTVCINLLLCADGFPYATYISDSNKHIQDCDSQKHQAIVYNQCYVRHREDNLSDAVLAIHDVDNKVFKQTRTAKQ